MRSLLFVPGDRPDRMEKAVAAGADIVILDLEDSVGEANKPEARRAVADFLDQHPGASLWVRISAQLPLLESKLEQVNLLDPLAQDARRLMGRHLPDLIDRYEKIPAAYRNERDAGGMTVDERLLSSLDAAREALDDIGSKLRKDDLTAFETQGRFIESRYKDEKSFEGN